MPVQPHEGTACSESPGRTARPEWLTQTLADQKQLAAGPPVDYSFKDLKTVLDLVLVEPTSGTARMPALSPNSNAVEYLETLEAAPENPEVAELSASAATPPTASPSSSPRNPLAAQPSSPAGVASHAAATASAGHVGHGAGALGARLNSNSLRLCNNHLMSLAGLGRVVRHVLDDPAQLVWLDVSSNQLSTIEDVILEFPSLQVLYLHGNAITALNDVLKLQGLPRLAKLTLHGNPIAEAKNYKAWVVAHLPGLRNMDFGAITKIERDKIDTWFKSTKKKH